MKFFFDNNLSKHLAHAMNLLCESDGDQVVALRDKFPQDATDLKWITDLGMERDWVIVSVDHGLFRKELEGVALRRSGLTAFFLAKGWGNKKFWEFAYSLMRWWPEIASAAKTNKGRIFEVPARLTGKLKPLAGSE